MNQQPLKRRNPFDVPKIEEPIVKQEEVVEDEPIEMVQPIYEEEKVVVKPQTQPKPQPKYQKVVQRQQYYQPEDVNREKYTSTMDVMLRRQIKIACATRGIMFAKFVEDACREKLAREGVR